MDYKKDIKDIGLTSHRAQNGMETFGITLSKKCERLATAVYLVTNFLSDTEPLKYRLRTLSIDFVRDAFFVKNSSRPTEPNVLEGLRANILETLSLLELAFVAGLVSEMNFTILKREYASLRDAVEVKRVSRESHSDSILGVNFFAPQFRAGSSTEPSATNTFSKGHSIGQTPNTMSDSSSRSDLKKLAPKVGPLFASTHRNRATTDIAKESRRSNILKLIKDNREVTIKDIASRFPELSEKTIQRELVIMSDTGVLKKSGERRWSRYTIA
ncbi:MAG: hypothetical protein AAB770_00225 [Patescibacteria group bacterium]